MFHAYFFLIFSEMRKGVLRRDGSWAKNKTLERGVGRGGWGSGRRVWFKKGSHSFKLDVLLWIKYKIFWTRPNSWYSFVQDVTLSNCSTCCESSIILHFLNFLSIFNFLLRWWVIEVSCWASWLQCLSWKENFLSLFV